IEYRNGVLEAIYVGDGRLVALPNSLAPGLNFRAEYFHQDHLGNNRLTFCDFNNNGRIEISDDPGTQENELEITQETHYYPFGLEHKGNWYATVAPDNNYLYNGKELNKDFGIDLYEYGARWYDPAIGRWTSVDPLAEKMPAWSPYSYTFNNPVLFIDPDGRMPMGPGDPPYLFQKMGQAANYIVNDFVPSVADKTVETFSAARESQAGQFVEEVANKTIGAFVDVGSSVTFPIINQTGVVIKEGVHEGPAYNDENNIVPNAYTLDEEWNLVPQEPMERMNAAESEKRGKGLIKNTVKVLTTVVGGPKETLVERGATMATKSAINKAAEKLLEVEECSNSCENP
ncbi:MAG: RHS repeat-associated core domain-containing protein, partial [Chitinophagales bacterium]|nr:RHS repeat-associated core domain-containing protein [Chitinophagales bacterium]